MATATTHSGDPKTTPPPSPGGTSEVAIFGRILGANHVILSVAAARAFLDLDFTSSDKDRMRALAAKAREGTLTTEEQAEINSYERAGHILSLMKLKARRALRSRNGASRKTEGH